MTFREISFWIADNPYLAAVLAAAVLACAVGITCALVHFMSRPVILLLVLNLFVHFLTYLLPRLLPLSYTFHDLTSALDRLTPFFSPMVTVYLFAFLQWALYWIMIGRETKELRSGFLAGEWISKFFCTAIFVFFPTTLVRPAVTGSGIFDRLTALVYLIDAPNNLFPSVHCLMSWFCLRSVFRFQNVPKWYRTLNLVFTPLVFLSTVMVKQHVWIDVPAAVLAAEAGLFLARKTHFDSVLKKLEDAFSKGA